MTAAEADSRVASRVLAREHWADEPTEVARAANRLEIWLRRRLCGGDKLLIKRLEGELGGQVKPSAKQRLVLERLVKRAEKRRCSSSFSSADR